MLTKDEVIQSRLTDLFNEIQDTESQIRSVAETLKNLETVKQLKQFEYQILNDVKDKGVIVADFGRSNSRLLLEDTLKRLFEKVGRPMTIAEVIEGLEEYGYKWSKYHTAYAQLRTKLEGTGARGYYQFK